MRHLCLAVTLAICGSAACAESVFEGTVREEFVDLPSVKRQFMGYTIVVATDPGTPIASSQEYRIVVPSPEVEKKLAALVGKKAKVRGLVGNRSFEPHLFVVAVE